MSEEEMHPTVRKLREDMFEALEETAKRRAPSRKVEEMAASIASLNDIMTELLISLASADTIEKSWVLVSCNAMAQHSENLGFRPQINAPLAWEDDYSGGQTIAVDAGGSAT